MMEPLLIGVDAGTTSAKAVLFNLDGDALDEYSESYGFVHTIPGGMEQRPEDWQRAVAEALRRLAASARGRGEIKAIAFSTQGGTVLPADEQGEPLCPAVTWLDKRGGEELERRRGRAGARLFVERTGADLAAGGVAAKLAWWRERRPDLFAQAWRFMQVNDWLAYQLTGRAVSDPSNAVIAGLYNLREGDWDPDLLKLVGLSPDRLSPIAASGEPVGEVKPELAEELGLPPGVIVASGGHDQYCGALGCGVVDEGAAMISCGTAWVLLAASEQLRLDPQRRALPGAHVAEDRYGLLIAMSNGGVAWDALRRLLLDERADSALTGEWDDALRDADDRGAALLFLPHLTGAGSPWRAPDARACLIGMDPHTSRADVLFAAMQGLCLETRAALDVMRELGVRVEFLRMIGGAARSPFWRQLLADVCQVEVRAPEHTEAACRGAAALAGVAAGLFPSAVEASRRLLPDETVVLPRPHRAARYELLAEARQAAFDGLAGAFDALARLRRLLADE